MDKSADSTLDATLDILRAIIFAEDEGWVTPLAPALHRREALWHEEIPSFIFPVV